MADKPTRKPAAKRRGPTKQAALKALGLTQEDLDALKDLRKQQAEAPAEEPQANVVESGEVTLKPVNLTAHAAAVEQTYRDDYQGQLENRPRPEYDETRLPDKPREQIWYVRNLRGMEFRFRMERNKGQTDQATVLKPRGQRGDMLRLQPGDINDDSLRTNVGLGIIEILPEGEAQQVLEKQSTNAQQRRHGPLDMLRSETGKEYAPGSVTVASDEEAYGIKVADLKPVAEGEYGELQVGRQGIERNLGDAGIGGNPAIVSDGFAAARQAQQPVQNPGLGQADQKSMEVDALARSKQFEGPGAGLGNVTVSVEPTRRG